MKLPQRHGEVLLVFLIINVCFGHVWSHPWLSAGALRWPPLAESGEGGQEWEAPVRAQQCWRQTCDPYGSLEWCVQWGTSRGVWMVMIPGRVCGCINRPLITRSFSGLMRLGCSLLCSLVLFWLIQGVEWSPEPWYRVMVTKWRCWLGDKPWQFELPYGVVKEQTTTDLSNGSCVSFIFAVNSWTKSLSYLITINKWAVRFVMTNCPLPNGPWQDYSTWCALWYTAVRKFGVLIKALMLILHPKYSKSLILWGWIYFKM